VARPRVVRGQFLGRVGNSGRSTGPHLHLHLEDANRPGSAAQPMFFERGQWAPRTNVFEGSNDAWASFAGQTLPGGDVFVWPPRRLAGELARHGLDAADYPRLFGHLADSGFWPEHIDGFSANGQVLLSSVWRPAQSRWLSYALLDGATYQRVIEDAARIGLSPWQVDSVLVGRETRFNAIFRPNLPGAWLARHDLTQAQHDAVFAQATQDGLRPVNVSVTSIDGQRLYTELYRAQETGSFELRSDVAETDYQAVYDQNAAAGRFPSYVNAYVHAGVPFYSVVFAQRPAGPRKDRHGMSATEYRAESDGAVLAGMPTRGVSSFDGAQGAPSYIAIWRR
jgi:hypothetical protein